MKILRYFVILILFWTTATATTFNDLKESRKMVTQTHETDHGNFQCNTEASCSNHGECNTDNNACVCSEKYATYECEKGHQCCYKRKERLVGGLLQGFLGLFGAGFFYIEQIGWGIIQIGLITGGFGILFAIACLPLCIDCDDNSTTCLSIITCLYSIFFVVAFGIWIYGIVVISTGDMIDGNGVELY